MSSAGRLPIDAVLPELVARLHTQDSTDFTPNMVIIAEPGAGKSTRVPPALAKGMPRSKWLVLQPRRIAARMLATRIAEEQGWELGREVGFHIRFERRECEQTQITLITEALLTRYLQSDPGLSGITGVILDEFHERSIHSDVGLALLREVQGSVRPDLRILVMSATLDPEPIQDFLGDCAVIRVGGRQYPVSVRYSPLSTSTSAGGAHRFAGGLPGAGALAEKITNLVESHAENISEDSSAAHTLVFLPGAGEIRAVEDRLSAAVRKRPDKPEIIALHSGVSNDEQARALSPSRRSKIILATNIAETSLTIDGVGRVIDSGLARVQRCDLQFGMDRLELSRISRASADQRAGRAGRQRAGSCVRLWSEAEHEGLRAFEAPEVLRIDLAPTLLALASWGVRDPHRFEWFEAPQTQRIQRSFELLQRLKLIARDGSLTPLGNRVMRIPLDPRLATFARIAADASFAEWGTETAVALSMSVQGEIRAESSHYKMPDAEISEIDETDVPHLIELARARRDFDATVETILRAISRGPARVGGRLDKGTPPRDHELRWWIDCFGDRLARRQKGSNEAVLTGGRRIRIDADTSVRRSELLIALDAREIRSEGRTLASAAHAIGLSIEDLERLYAEEIADATVCEWDESKNCVVATRVRSFRGFALEKGKPVALGELDEDLEHASEILFERMNKERSKWLHIDTEAGRLIQRLKFAAQRAAPELADVLQGQLSGWIEASLREGCRGHIKRAQFESFDLAEDLKGRVMGAVGYAAWQELEREAPDRYTVPSGRTVRLGYEDHVDRIRPVLEIKLQEIFGMMTTPRIGWGGAPIRMSLLAPNMRPVQITEDLSSFWNHTYAEVRKELRARYPKHAWPEDPLTAPPQRRGQ